MNERYELWADRKRMAMDGVFEAEGSDLRALGPETDAIGKQDK